MNTFMNFVNKSLVGGRTKGGVGTLGRIGALLLLASDFLGASASSFYSIGSTKGLMQEFCRVVQDFGAITEEEKKDQGRNSSKQAS